MSTNNGVMTIEYKKRTTGMDYPWNQRSYITHIELGTKEQLLEYVEERYSEVFSVYGIEDCKDMQTDVTLKDGAVSYVRPSLGNLVNLLSEKEEEVVVSTKTIDCAGPGNLFTMALRFDSTLAHRAENIKKALEERYLEYRKERAELYLIYIRCMTLHNQENFENVNRKMERLADILHAIKKNYNV